MPEMQLQVKTILQQQYRRRCLLGHVGNPEDELVAEDSVVVVDEVWEVENDDATARLM